VRYLFILLLLFVQLTTGIAEAGTPLPANNGSHQRSASLLANGFLHDHLAEVAHTIQFNCVAFNVRDHRDTDGAFTIARLSNYLAGDLRKRINACSAPHSSSLIRLLLFPNHYFW
jgi:hypothetical protein